jgi:nitric oxide reductase NorQ protein
MSVWINFDFESVGDRVSQQEIALLVKRTEVDQETAYKIIRVGAEMRRQYKAGDLPYGPSIGDLIHWAVLIKDGSDAMSSAEETIVALTSDSIEVQGDVRRLIESVFKG